MLLLVNLDAQFRQHVGKAQVFAHPDPAGDRLADLAWSNDNDNFSHG